MNLEREIRILEQIVIEDSYSRRKIRKAVKEEIQEYYPDAILLAISAISAHTKGSYYPSKEKRLNHLVQSSTSYEDVALDIFASVMLCKGVTNIQQVASAIGLRLGYENVFDGIKTASELLAVIRHTGVYDIYPAGAYGTYMTVKPRIKPSEGLKAHMVKVIYLPPMLCEPVPWVSNYGGGHITQKETLLLGGDNHHNEYQNLKAINILQGIAFQLDEEVMKEQELPKKKLEGKDKDQFDDHVNQARKIYKHYAGRDFWFVWKYDKRGRMYNSGYHITLQGSEYKKALLNFKTKEVISLT